MKVDLERQLIEMRGRDPIPFRDRPPSAEQAAERLHDLEEIEPHLPAARAMRERDEQERPWIYRSGDPTALRDSTAVLRPRPGSVRHTGIAAPFRQPDLESEIIAPVGADLEDLHAVHLYPATCLSRATPTTGPGPASMPSTASGTDPTAPRTRTSVLNQAPYRDASILIAGRNFGQGSQQAFAVIRLLQCGMRVVIAPSFGPVFHDDCFDFGLLPVTLDEPVVAQAR